MARSRQGQGEVQARSRQDQYKVKAKQSNHIHKHDYNLMGFDTIVTNLVLVQKVFWDAKFLDDTFCQNLCSGDTF